MVLRRPLSPHVKKYASETHVVSIGQSHEMNVCSQKYMHQVEESYLHTTLVSWFLASYFNRVTQLITLLKLPAGTRNFMGSSILSRHPRMFLSIFSFHPLKRKIKENLNFAVSISTIFGLGTTQVNELTM